MSSNVMACFGVSCAIALDCHENSTTMTKLQHRVARFIGFPPGVSFRIYLQLFPIMTGGALRFPGAKCWMMSRFPRESKRTALRPELLFRRSYGWRLHFCNFGKQIGLPVDSFQVRILLAAVIVDLVSLKEIFILNEQLNRLVAAFRLPDRCVQIVRTPLPSIHRN